MKNAINQLVAEVAKINGNRFASLTYTAKGTGEVARHTLQLGFSYHNAVVNSLKALPAVRFSNVSGSGKFSRADFVAAKREVRASLRETLAAHAIGEQNPNFTKADVYVPLFNGLNVSKTDGSFKLYGLTVAKTVLVSGTHKPVNSKPLTLAKNAIRRALPVGAFREFAIDENTLALAKINGETIEM